MASLPIIGLLAAIALSAQDLAEMPAAWTVAAVVYVAIHAYYGPHPRTEDSYFGADMFLRSLGMPGQSRLSRLSSCHCEPQHSLDLRWSASPRCIGLPAPMSRSMSGKAPKQVRRD